MPSLNAQSRKRFSSRFTSAARLSNWTNADGTTRTSTSTRGTGTTQPSNNNSTNNTKGACADGKSSVSTLESPGGGGASFDLRPQDHPRRNLDLSDFATDDEFSVEYAHVGVSDALGRRGVTGSGPSRRGRGRATKATKATKLALGRHLQSILAAPSPRAALRRMQDEASAEEEEDVRYQPVGGDDDGSAGSDSDGLVGVHVYSDERDEDGREEGRGRWNGNGTGKGDGGGGVGHAVDHHQGSDRWPRAGETTRGLKSDGSGGGCAGQTCSGRCASCASCVLYTLCWILVRLLLLLAASGMVYGVYRLVLDVRRGDIQVVLPGTGGGGGSAAAAAAAGSSSSDASQVTYPPIPSPIIAPTMANLDEQEFEEEEAEEVEEAEEDLLDESEQSQTMDAEDTGAKEQQPSQDMPPSAMTVSLSANDPSGIATPRFRLMHNAILQRDVSDAEVLKPRVSFSPQLRALDWVANVDPQKLDLDEDNPSDDEAQPAYLYRYALATLWFSTHAREDGRDATAEPASEEDALRDFQFVPWSDERGWMSGAAVCFWSGIKCGNGVPHEIDLTNFALDGTIPRELFTVLNRSISSLRLARNKLRGTLSEDVGRMQSLMILDLQENPDLEGAIPRSLLYSMPGLRKVRLGQCSFSGDVPEINWPDLEVLDMAWLGLTGTLPRSISNSKNLRVLTLSGNSLTGNLPDVSGMDDLIYLELDQNKFTGSLYADLPQSLVALLLQRNELTGSIPERMVQHDLLEELVLGYNNNLSGPIPASFSLPKLRLLRLSNNAFEGSLPWEKLTTYETLESIELAENDRFGGTISGDFSRLVNLKHLSIFHTRITGTIPESICALVDDQSLEVLTTVCGDELPLVECNCCAECWDG